ncbi:acyl-CoA N-acyltransferase [Ilyonectria destructans]|nr:acyl-CoA N-acyltransferase [Ilyonectria destructans]
MGQLPPAPSLGKLRIATPDDVLRIGIVAAAGFKYSPLFRWERPFHEEYPEDTLASYRTQFEAHIQSDDFAVLVLEDVYDPCEGKKTEATIPQDNGWEPPKAGTKVVVGVMSLKLEPNSPRRGQFKSRESMSLHRFDNAGRDSNRRRYDSWGSLSGSKKREYCDGDSVISMIVVHPAYWNRGYGTALMQWAKDLSVADGVKQCVSAVPMSERLFRGLGFKHICYIVAEGDEDDAEGVTTALLEYDGSVTGNLSG